MAVQVAVVVWKLVSRDLGKMSSHNTSNPSIWQACLGTITRRFLHQDCFPEPLAVARDPEFPKL